MPRGTEPGPSIYPDCGTLTAAGRHQRERTKMCQPCRDKKAKYMRNYRHGNGINKARLVPDAVIKKHGIKVTA
jgi:hypothetical protein